MASSHGNPLRILQVGLGNRGRMWGQIIDGRGDVVHSAVVDIDRSRLQAFALAHPQIATYTDLEAALAETESDAVLLVTPPQGHLLQACQVFAAGLPLLAEKPLTLDLGEAVSIVDQARRASLPLMVGLNFRFLPVSQTMRKLIAGGDLGSPGFGQFVYQRNRDGRAPHLNKYPLTMQHPMMLEQTIHHLDLMRFCYAREVEQVVCRTWNPAWSMYAHDSNVNCLLTMQRGLEVNYLGTWTGGWNQLEFQWRTDCSRGIVVQRGLFADLAVARMDDPALAPVALPPCEPFYDDSSALLSAFIAHLREGAPLLCSGADHLYTLALCFAAMESSETGKGVRLADVYQRHAIPEPPCVS